eukprot:6096277-Prymnesium_polylepis.1
MSCFSVHLARRQASLRLTARPRLLTRHILTRTEDHNTRFPQPNFYNDLDACFHHAWSALRDAPTPRRSTPYAAFRKPVLASCDRQGYPHQRVMVLRGVDCEGLDEPTGAAAQPASLPRLRFHSDVRAPKYRHFVESPRCAVLFYDKGQKLQLRVSGTVTLRELQAGCEEATAAWRGSAAASRRCYYMGAGPSERTSLEELLALEDDVLSADAANEEAISPHFACIFVHVHELEFLYLSHTGSRRAVARYALDGGSLTQSCEWLVP